MFFDNAVLRRELLTSLRTRKSFVLLALFIGVLGGAILLGWPAQDVVSTSAQVAIAIRIFRFFMMGAILMVSMMAPAFSAGAITMEKEKRSIDLLMTSPLTPATIVAGKFGASLGYLLLLIFATLPLLSLCVMIPGVEPEEVMSVYVILLATASTFGMIGLTASAFFDRTHAALAITYLIVLPFSLMLLALSSATKAFFTPQSAITVGILAGVACTVMYAAIAARMKKPFEPELVKDEDQELVNQTGLVLVSEQFPDKWLHPSKRDEFLPDGCNPVFQKELRAELFGKGALFLRLLIQISSVLTIGFIWTLFIGEERYFVWYLISFSMLVGPAFAAGAFTQERERGTRDMLLGTLVSPRQVVLGKFYAAVRSCLILTGLLALPLLLGPIFSDFTFVQLIFHVVVIAVGLVGCVTMAMTYSLFLRTTSQSMTMSYLSVFVLYLGPEVLKRVLWELSNIKPEFLGWLAITSPFSASSAISDLKGENLQGGTAWWAFVLLWLVLTAIGLAVMHYRFSRVWKGKHLD